jgi:hypothetical protein
MDVEDFKVYQSNMSKNIKDIKEIIKNEKILESPDCEKIVEKLKYFFYSVTKTLTDIGHSIILEKDLRTPLNRADVFISLAEQEIIMPSIVPGIKKAVFALPRIKESPYADDIEIVSTSINDLTMCLDSFSIYFGIGEKES